MHALLLILAIGADEAEKNEPVLYELPEKAVAEAVRDARENPLLASTFRYVWHPSGDKNEAKYVAYPVNETINRSDILLHPKQYAEGHISRWDFALLGSQDAKQIKELLTVWEKFAKDEPYFLTELFDDEIHLPEGGVKILEENETHVKIEMSKEFVQDGKTYKAKWFLKSQLRRNTGKRDFSPTVDLLQAEELKQLTGSNVPIVRADWFVKRIEDTAEKGVYYDFLGVEKKPAKGTAQEAFLLKFGADEKTPKDLRSDQRVGMFFSQVTGKPRAVSMFHGRGAKVGVAQSIIAITQDVKDEDVDPNNHAMKNLIEFKFAATEIIAERATGLHAYALFNDKGELQTEAPPNVVRDNRIPIPYTDRLQGAISCIRCHNAKAKEGGAGWQPLTNDVKTINAARLDIFGEKSRFKGVSTEDALRIAGLYTGDFTKPLVRGRDDYTDAVVRLSNGMDFQDVSDGIVDLYNDYWYKRVDAELACQEIGLKVERGTLPKDALLSALAIPIAGSDGIIEEHPAFGALFAGLAVNRLDWEEVYGQAVFRLLQNKKKVKENQGGEE